MWPGRTWSALKGWPQRLLGSYTNECGQELAGEPLKRGSTDFCLFSRRGAGLSKACGLGDVMRANWRHVALQPELLHIFFFNIHRGVLT